MDEESLHKLLNRCWSSRTSTKWTPENPAAGQCAVTALVLQDHFGGGILKTKTGDLWYFYNEIDGRRVDLTASQFSDLPAYSDTPSSREEAFEDATQEHYRALSERFSEQSKRR